MLTSERSTAEQLQKILGDDWIYQNAEGEPSPNLARRLALALRQSIVNDLLAPGTRLPPERALAAILGVSRPTVTAALDDLRGEGLLEAQQGSGTWVALRTSPSGPTLSMADLVFAGHGINLAAATPQDASHLGALSVNLSDLLGTNPAHGIDPSGRLDLRERIAGHLKSDGSVDARSDNVIVTNGAHHALALITGSLIEPGDRVVVESLTYGGIVDLLKYRRAKAVVVERDDEGMLPDALRRVIRTSSPTMVYWMPRAHAPTGTVSTPERHHEISSILAASNVVVVEDDTLADVRIEPHLPRIVSEPTAIRVGSLAKLAWGGLRIGWVHAPSEITSTLLRNRTRTDLGTSIAAQLFGAQVFDHFDELSRRRARELKNKRDYLCGALANVAPEWEIVPAAVGLSLWVKLPVRDSQIFTNLAGQRGVHVMPGAIARADRKHDAHIRICFDRNVNVLTEAVERLGSAWSLLGSQRPATKG